MIRLIVLNGLRAFMQHKTCQCPVSPNLQSLWFVAENKLLRNVALLSILHNTESEPDGHPEEPGQSTEPDRTSLYDTVIVVTVH